MAKKTQNGSNAGGIITVAAAAVAAAAGAYFLYGSKDAKKNRNKIKGWAVKAKGEVLERLENLKEVNEEKYHQVVDAVMKKYETVKSIDQVEVAALMKELKTHWGKINKELKAAGSKAKKTVKKTVDAVKKG